MKVLVADDEQTTSLVLANLLKKWGYTPIIAKDGKQALDLLKENKDINIALLDWMMPFLSGPEIIKEFSSTSNVQPLYSILITGLKEKNYIIEALNIGVDDFISKPIDPDIVRARLNAGRRVIEAQTDLRSLADHLEEVVNERTSQLTEALNIARNASEMKSTFLANMSHEIRTPLNGIVSYIELLLYSDLNDEQREDLQTIRGCTHSLRTIINDVLDFSKIEAGRMLIEKASFNIRSTIKEVLDILLYACKEKELTISCNISEKVPNCILGDRVRLQQIVTNLFSNAIKFSNNGGVIEVLCEPSYIEDQYSGINISIKDRGIGIPVEKIESIFESFTQADSSTTRKYGGTGLGLTIVKKLCKIMQGDISVTSEVNKGSTFTVYLPLPSAEEFLEEQQRELKDFNFNGLKILLAEDNLVNQHALQRVLENVGCSVVATCDGNDFLAEATKSEFDLLLLDIQMPNMGGEEASMKLREGGGRNSQLPIIALSANVFSQDFEKYKALGINEILPKPLDYKKLFSTIEHFSTLGD